MLRCVYLMVAFFVCCLCFCCLCPADIVMFIGEENDAEVVEYFEGICAEPFRDLSQLDFGIVDPQQAPINSALAHRQSITQSELFCHTVQPPGIVSANGNIIPVADSLTNEDSINLAFWDFQRKVDALENSTDVWSRKAKQLSEQPLRR